MTSIDCWMIEDEDFDEEWGDEDGDLEFDWDDVEIEADEAIEE